jgi:hypothetical protein
MTDWTKDIDRIMTQAANSITEMMDEVTDEVRYDVIEAHPVFKAINRLLSEVNEHGTCLLCEQSFNFHANNCVVHDIVLALSWEPV